MKKERTEGIRKDVQTINNKKKNISKMPQTQKEDIMDILNLDVKRSKKADKLDKMMYIAKDEAVIDEASVWLFFIKNHTCEELAEKIKTRILALQKEVRMRKKEKK